MHTHMPRTLYGTKCGNIVNNAYGHLHIHHNACTEEQCVGGDWCCPGSACAAVGAVTAFVLYGKDTGISAAIGGVGGLPRRVRHSRSLLRVLMTRCRFGWLFRP